jgi:hypothetical protein
MISSVHGDVVLQVVPVFAVMVVGLNVILCSVPDCSDVTVPEMVNGPYTNVGIEMLLVTMPFTLAGAPGPTMDWTLSLAQSGVQNWISSACAESGAIRAAVKSGKAILRLFMVVLPCLVVACLSIIVAVVDAY